MKNLMTLVDECEKELDAIGIPYRTVRSWTVNTRAQCRWGQCKTISDGVFDINISEKLLGDDIPDISAKSTIIHELLHTVKGCYGHKGKWQLLAEKVNEAYPQYNIKRTATPEEQGVAVETTSRRTLEWKYQIVCSKCGFSSYRKKASKVITHPQHYRCARCGGKLQIGVI